MNLFSSRRTLGAVILAGAASTTAWAAPRALSPAGAATFNAAQTGYAVAFPVRPQVQTRTQGFAGRSVAFHIAQATSGPFTFVVVSNGYPSGVQLSSPHRQLDAVQRGFLGSAGGAGFSVLRREELSLNGTPGRELLLGSPSAPKQIRLRLFHTRRHAYQLMAIGPKNASAAQRAQSERFLDSFRLLPGA